MIAETLAVYSWSDQAPANLQTRAQLATEGLKPGRPVRGRVVWRNGRRNADLYDLTEATLKKAPTEAQRVALAKGRRAADTARRTYSTCGDLMPFPITHEDACLTHLRFASTD